MQFIKFKEQLKDLIVFNTQTIRLLDRNFDFNVLSDWQKKGYIKKIIRGFYIFSDIDINDPIKYYISNKIYQPSYISLERALSFYGLIPETVWAVTAISSRKTQTFETYIGTFVYRNLKPELIFGYTLDHLRDYTYKLATIEKTVLDYFYLDKLIKSKKDLEDLRFDYNLFLESANLETFMEYLERFKNKSFQIRVKKLLGEIQ